MFQILFHILAKHHNGMSIVNYGKLIFTYEKSIVNYDKKISCHLW
jgi:hypothetical protein